MASCEHNSSKRKHNDDLSETSTTEGSQISRKRSRSEGDADSSCTHTTVDIIPVSSAVLSGQSPYFFTLFKNSDEEEVNIRIQRSERQSMRELLKFMYILKLPWTTSGEVLAILILADKYNVPRCVKYCTNMLCNQPMTVEHALEYLELPSRLTMRADLEQLTKEATQFLQTHYRDTINLEKDIMELSLLGLEAVLTSDRLSLDYEDSIFDLVLKWAERHYVELKERRNILQTRLIRHIRFPFMSEQKLKCVWKCKLLDPMVSHKVVLEALLFKGGVGHLKSFSTLTQEQLTERFYKYKPVKVVECNLPRKEATIFLELRMNECENLYPAGRLHSQVFSFDGFSFTIRVQCYQDPESMSITFGLGVAMIASKPTHLLVDVKFSTRRKPSFDYEYSHSFEHLFTENSGVVGTNDLLKTTWDSFIGSNSVYFFDKNLYIKVELKVINLV